jgi:hypothetical protein
MWSKTSAHFTVKTMVIPLDKLKVRVVILERARIVLVIIEFSYVTACGFICSSYKGMYNAYCSYRAI